MNEQRKNDNDATAFRIIKSMVLGIVGLTVTYFYLEKRNSNVSNVLKYTRNNLYYSSSNHHISCGYSNSKRSL